MSGRPPSVRLFAQLYAAGIACAAIAGLLSWQEWHERATVAGAVPAGLTGGLLVGIALSVAVPLLLLWLVAERGSATARWVAVALVAVGAAAIGWVVARQGRVPGLVGGFDLIRLVLEGVGLAVTFRGEAQGWFATRKGELP